MNETQKAVGERIKTLRDGAGLSQMKICALNKCNQSNLARYENGKAPPPLKLLVWYADYFDVSLDYVFGRTDVPEGKLYSYNPRIDASTDEMRKFIEMCFDPESSVSEKMKHTLLEMFIAKEGVE